MALTPEGTPYVESTDLVANYPAASLSLADRVDLVGVLPFANSTARASALPSPTDGQYSYLQNTNSTEYWNGSAWVGIGVAGIGSNVVQVVRTSVFSTTSTTPVSVTGMTVNITPTSATSKVLVMAQIATGHSVSDQVLMTQLRRGTTGLNLSNTGNGYVPVRHPTDTSLASTLIALDSPSTTSSVSYNVAIYVNTGTGYVNRSTTYTAETSSSTIMAIEVAG